MSADRLGAEGLVDILGAAPAELDALNVTTVVHDTVTNIDELDLMLDREMLQDVIRRKLVLSRLEPVGPVQDSRRLPRDHAKELLVRQASRGRAAAGFRPDLNRSDPILTAPSSGGRKKGVKRV